MPNGGNGAGGGAGSSGGAGGNSIEDILSRLGLGGAGGGQSYGPGTAGVGGGRHPRWGANGQLASSGGRSLGGWGGGGGGGAVQGGGGVPPPGVRSSYTSQENPLYREMMDILKQQMATAQGLYDKAPDFSGQRAEINKMQSIAANEAAQRAAAAGRGGQTTAMQQQTLMGNNQAMTGAARQWGNEALKHQEDVLNSMNTLAGIMSGNTNASAGNMMAQLAEQRAQNALGLEGWKAQQGLDLERYKAQTGGAAALLGALFPYMQMQSGGRANPQNLV